MDDLIESGVSVSIGKRIKKTNFGHKKTTAEAMV